MCLKDNRPEWRRFSKNVRSTSVKGAEHVEIQILEAGFSLLELGNPKSMSVPICEFLVIQGLSLIVYEGMAD